MGLCCLNEKTLKCKCSLESKKQSQNFLKCKHKNWCSKQKSKHSHKKKLDRET